MGMHLIDTGKFGAIGPRSLDSPEVLVYQTGVSVCSLSQILSCCTDCQNEDTLPSAGCPDGCPCSTATTGAPAEFAACTTGTSPYVWVSSPTVAVNTFCLVWGTCNSQKYDWQAGLSLSLLLAFLQKRLRSSHDIQISPMPLQVGRKNNYPDKHGS